MSRDDLRERVASRYASRFLRGYARGKIGIDPVYHAVGERLSGQTLPLLDVGCGAGVLAVYLRESGMTVPIVGIDHDAAKIAHAESATAAYRDVRFISGDVRNLPDFLGSVLLIDVLHYVAGEDQRRLLEDVVRRTAPGGVVLIREAVRDGTWHYRVAVIQETLSRLVRWLKAERLHFASRDEIVAPFRDAGFSADVVPMWGGTPFNNYLFVFRRE
ncbi:MAG TPA: class I SAM-dependent methyltransferase [Thermoanaerobaculia bacterium]|nr:class I SAM-dependent methyltransferase [Thermoanaerobaculia bacterium]